MKKLFTFIAVICLALNASAQYQVANSDFEEWETSTSETAEPCHWNSFKTASGSYAFMAGQQMEKVTGNDAHGGSASVKITARSVLGVVAQGNMTTGQINMGSTSAGEGSKNYNYTKTGDSKFNQPFSGLPDAMEVYINASIAYSAKATALLHGNGYYYDPGDNNDGDVALIASATDFDITTTNGWVKKTIPCTYSVTDGTRPAYALITFSTSATAGKGNKNDWMCVDDIKFLYYSELESAEYDGTAITFNGTSATVNEYYDASKLNITSNGHGAKVETSMDESKQLLTVTINGDNISEDATNYHTYTIQFKKYDKGDVNKDGSVTIADVTALVNIILGKGGDDDMANVNGDEGITIADVTALVNIILGKN